MPRGASDGSLVRLPRPHPFGGRSREQFLAELKRALAGRVRAAYLFGSAATGTMHPDSDVDLMLVVDSPLPFLERWQDFEDLFGLAPRLDLLVYTPAE